MILWINNLIFKNYYDKKLNRKNFFEKNGYIQLSNKINNEDFDRLCEKIIFETNKFYSENLDKIKNLEVI